MKAPLNTVIVARHTRDRRASRLSQKGSGAVEFALLFPLFFMVLYAIVSYSLIYVEKQVLTMAAEEGARTALNYQQATTISAAMTARTAAACTAASGMTTTLVAAATCTASSAACTYNTAMQCVNVTMSYNYAANPILPPMPLMGFALPTTLASSAMVQLNPENIL